MAGSSWICAAQYGLFFIVLVRNSCALFSKLFAFSKWSSSKLCGPGVKQGQVGYHHSSRCLHRMTVPRLEWLLVGAEIYTAVKKIILEAKKLEPRFHVINGLSVSAPFVISTGFRRGFDGVPIAACPLSSCSIESAVSAVQEGFCHLDPPLL
jgi:hypothetical protein